MLSFYQCNSNFKSFGDSLIKFKPQFKVEKEENNTYALNQFQKEQDEILRLMLLEQLLAISHEYSAHFFHGSRVVK